MEDSRARGNKNDERDARSFAKLSIKTAIALEAIKDQRPRWKTEEEGKGPGGVNITSDKKEKTKTKNGIKKKAEWIWVLGEGMAKRCYCTL